MSKLACLSRAFLVAKLDVRPVLAESAAYVLCVIQGAAPLKPALAKRASCPTPKRLSALSAALLAGVLSFQAAAAPPPSLPMNDDNFLRMPVVGDHSLRLLSGNVVEVMMVTAKDPDPAPLTTWNFLDAAGNGTLPAASSFTVSVNGSAVPVTAVGFKRRVLYAPLRVRDLRIANWLYLQLGSPLPVGAAVTVANPGGAIWSSSVIFSATNSALRYSPAIHVNQAGYVSGTLGGNSAPKKAMVGYYLGTLGELAIPSTAGFQLVNAQSGAVAFSGSLTRRRDVGYSYTPTPYQQVFEADFSSFNTPGEYKLVVPGLGASFPFFIDDGMAATYARTYALGLYHNRCGTDNVQPFTRHTHGVCHTNLVLIPSVAGPEQDFVNYVLNQESAGATSNPRHTAPRMVNVAASLYPFVNTGLIDARGGHHDAGDYSKYTTSVAAFIHSLTFAVDSLPGVKELDNLGIPESGDGISDLIQEAKWEADYLGKLQDADGGFYFIVYPRTRRYELDALPEQGDSQLVLPKNTAATAAAVGALAEIASSPTFKAAYPAAAASYLAKAVKGWQFLQTAIARYGKDGAYQMITFSGDVFMHDDELAWAAAALYVATGDPVYNTALRAYMPNPNSQALRRWDWWSMFGGWGCATRDYGFAVRSGKLTAGQIDPAYLALCEAEIKLAGSNAVNWSAKMAYGSSFTDESKGIRVAGWYFSGEWTMDPAAAWVVDSSSTTKPLYLDAILKNYNYEMGCNPVNVTYLTGLGSKRQREIVHQYALNDRRVLPPGGIPLGNIQAQYDYLLAYKTELSSVSFPLDSAPSAPYAYYDRWADTFNVTTEFIISQTAKTLPAAAMLMAMGPAKTQVWRSATAQIVNLPATTNSTSAVSPSLTSSVDLSKARIVWESGNNIAPQEPFLGPSYTFTPGTAGVQWLEAEAQLPDGRRLVVVTNFTATLQVTNPIEQYQTIPLAQNTNVVAWYTFDNTFADAKGFQSPFTPAGNAVMDNSSFTWASRPNGGALRLFDLGDGVSVNLPNSSLVNAAQTDALSIEAMVFVNRQVAYSRGNADLFVLTKTWNAEFALRHNIWTPGPTVTGGVTAVADYVTLGNYLKPGQWQHLKIKLSRTAYTVAVDGQTVATVPSTDLANWGGSGNAILKLGGFDGWMDEVIVKNEGTAIQNPAPGVKPTVSVAAPDANASEVSLDPATFTFIRAGDLSLNLTVAYAIGGTAANGLDYRVIGSSITIPAGSTAVSLALTPLADLLAEGSENVVLTLAADASYNIGSPPAAIVAISDASVAAVLPTVTVIAVDANASEDGDPGAFLVTRVGNLTTNLSVQLTTAGTATSGSDYSALPALMTIPAGSASASLAVTPLTDAWTESAETVLAAIAASGHYLVGTPAAATVTIADSAGRPTANPGTNYVTAVTELDSNIVALYRFDGNYTDAAGRNGSFTPGGAAGFDSSNLGWMEKVGGAALRVRNLGDRATVTLHNAELYKPGLTESVVIEAMVFINQYKAYGLQTASLLKLERRWDAQLLLNQEKWEHSSQVMSALQTIAEPPTLAQYLKTNCWQRISLLIDTNGYVVRVNDREVARVASTDLTRFAGSGDVALELGNFDGWLDELVVRSNGKAAVLPPALSIGSLTRTPGGMLLRWAAAAGLQFQVQWKPSLASTAWTSFTNTVSSTNGSFSFLDNGTQTGGLGGTRFYRLLQVPALTISSLTRTPGGMSLQWRAAAGSQFRVQWKPSLTSTNWTTFNSTITSTDGVFAYLDTGTQALGLPGMRFYRLLKLP